MNTISWIDLPDDNYLDVLGYQTMNTQELNTLIQKYNQITKDQAVTLPCRIKKLNHVIEFIQEWIEKRLEPIDKKKHLLWIADIAVKKRNYLSALLDIYENHRYQESSQYNYHHDISRLKDKSKQAVILNNQRFFSLKMKEYWGDFWFETLDPCHRRLTPFLDQWRALKKVDGNLPHFFMWLETQHLPKYVPQVTYLKNGELEKCRLMIKNGCFWEKTENEWIKANFNQAGKRYLFSIDLDGEIYAKEEGEGISHSSFTSGQPVLGAGLLQIRDGMLASLALESGHYMPTSDVGFQIFKIFEEKGARFPEQVEVIFFFDRNKYHAEITPSDLRSCEQFKKVLESIYNHKERCCHEPVSV
jgi:hypothetical protein